jgi:hypothetical protein
VTEINNTKNQYKKSSTVDFFAKYKDPRWQKKRLEVMQNANFKCESCGDDGKTLNVHHKSYKKNHDPWEYECYELECLCEDCHREKHEVKERLTSALHDFKTDYNFTHTEEELIGYLEGKMADGPFGVIPLGYGYLRGFCEAYLLDVDKVNADGKLSEIIEVANGYINFEMFELAFLSQPIYSKRRAKYLRERIAAGEYSHYPDWLLEKIARNIEQVSNDE